MNSDVLNRLAYVAIAVLLAILAEFFVWGNSLGLGFVLFIFIFLILFVGFAIYFKHVRNKWAFLLLVPIAILCFDIFRLNNELVTSLGPVLVFGLVFLFCILLVVRNSQMQDFAFRRIPVVRNVFLVLQGLPHVFSDIFFPVYSSGKNKNMKMIFIGLLIAVPIVWIFLGLFMSADAIFADWVKNVFDLNLNISYWMKVLRVCVFGILLSSFFYVLISEKHDLLDKAVSAVRIDNVISTVILGIVNLLFLSFVFFQIRYLFGDADFVLENGLKFAEYARSGFFELAWVMAFAFILIIIIYWSTAHHENSKLVNGLQIFLVLQVGVVAASALSRMNIYQDAYGYTVLRLYVEWFIYFVLSALTFVVVALFIQLKFNKFFYAGLVMGLTALVIVFSVNVDYIISKKNVERYLEAKDEKVPFDVTYLEYLSVDVLPIFVEYRKSDFAEREYIELRKMLELNYSELDKFGMTLFEYNFGKAKAFSLREELDGIYDVF